MSITIALAVVTCGVMVGILSALFGVGGGVIMVPFMVLLLDKTEQVAIGTSLLVIVPTAAAGLIAHRKHGYGSMRQSLLVAFGGLFGSFAGAKLALRLPSDTLGDLFACLVVISGLRLIYQGAREASAARRSS